MDILLVDSESKAVLVQTGDVMVDILLVDSESKAV